MNNKRRVCFDSGPHERIDYDDGLSLDERQEVCWYSNEELTESRLDAKRAIQTLLSNGGNVDNIHHDDRKVNFRGVEKYANSKVRALRKTKLLVQSVLLRQTEHKLHRGSAAVCLKEELAALSKRLSSPCRDLAHLHASKYMEKEKLDDSILCLYKWSNNGKDGSSKRRRVCYQVDCNETTAMRA